MFNACFKIFMHYSLNVEPLAFPAPLSVVLTPIISKELLYGPVDFTKITGEPDDCLNSSLLLI